MKGQTSEIFGTIFGLLFLITLVWVGSNSFMALLNMMTGEIQIIAGVFTLAALIALLGKIPSAKKKGE